MLDIDLGGEIAAESHGDCTRHNFGHARRDDNVRVLDRPGESGGQGERDCQAVRHAGDNVADGFRGGKMRFDVA